MLDFSYLFYGHIRPHYNYIMIGRTIVAYIQRVIWRLKSQDFLKDLLVILGAINVLVKVLVMAMCLFHVSLQSRMSPRYFTSLTGCSCCRLSAA